MTEGAYKIDQSGTSVRLSRGDEELASFDFDDWTQKLKIKAGQIILEPNYITLYNEGGIEVRCVFVDITLNKHSYISDAKSSGYANVFILTKGLSDVVASGAP